MVRLGLLIARQGPAGLWSPSAEAFATLAIEELNSASGLLGEEIELVTLDAGCTGRSAAATIDDAISFGGVGAVVGMFPSYARSHVSAAIGGRVPFVYTPQFEGLETDRAIVTVGETSKELLEPGVHWLTTRKSAKRFFLVGNDYVWPRQSFVTARRAIHSAGARVVGERLVPFGFNDYDSIFAALSATRADVVVPYFLGNEAVSFNRAFAEAGWAGKVLRFSSAIDETVIYGVGPENTENIYVTSGYFGSMASDSNRSLLERYHTRFGENPPPANAFGQSCYEGIYALIGLAEAAEGLDVPQVANGIGRAVQHRTARSDNGSGYVGERRPIHFARVDGLEFKMIAPN